MPGVSFEEPVETGQSSIDFVVGFAVFILAFTFVILLIPELLSPQTAPERTVVANRATGTLVGDLLTGVTVGTLNETCTEEFFTASGSSCAFDATASTQAILGISDRHDVNITVGRNGPGESSIAVVCYNGSAVVDCSTGGQPLTRGPSPPVNVSSVRTAHRLIRVDGETLVLTLRAW